MVWLFAGFLLLFLAATASGPVSSRPMRIQVVAMLVAVATLWGSLGVYPRLAALALFLVSGGLALCVQWFVRPRIRIGRRAFALVLGSAFAAFALFGPRGGLF
jgi:hypothetical protein